MVLAVEEGDGVLSRAHFSVNQSSVVYASDAAEYSSL